MFRTPMLVALVVVSSTALSQQPPAAGAPPLSHLPAPAASADPLARFVYPPELVMAHQEAIGLTDKQRSAIQDAVKEAQGKVVDLQFKLSAEVEKLQRLLQSPSPAWPAVPG